MSNLLGTPILKRFFEGHVPRAVKALETIAKRLAEPEPPAAATPEPLKEPVDLWAWAAGYVGREPVQRDPVIFSVAVQIQQRLIDEIKAPGEPHLLVLSFDITGWTDEQIAALAFEAKVQGEENDDHPEARLFSQKVLRPR